MTSLDFVQSTVCNLTQPVFDELKQLLLGEYISFSFIDTQDVSEKILAEKICDYFDTLEVKTGRPFDRFIETYLNDLDSIVEPHIAKTPQAKKGDTTPVTVPRARKYYEKAAAIKRVKNPSVGQLIDYSRLMLCLYSAAIQSEVSPIDDFDYAADCLIPENIIDSMKDEEVWVVFPISKRKRFETKELYSDDICTLILSILILCLIINGKV